MHPKLKEHTILEEMLQTIQLLKLFSIYTGLYKESFDSAHKTINPASHVDVVAISKINS